MSDTKALKRRACEIADQGGEAPKCPACDGYLYVAPADEDPGHDDDGDQYERYVSCHDCSWPESDEDGEHDSIPGGDILKI